MDTAYVKGTFTPKTSLLDTGPGNPPFLVPESFGDVSRPHLCKLYRYGFCKVYNWGSGILHRNTGWNQ